ncbi:MAG: hypothetical protein WBP03_04970 [Candidatus Saccharimonadales bacterium]
MAKPVMQATIGAAIVAGYLVSVYYQVTLMETDDLTIWLRRNWKYVVLAAGVLAVLYLLLFHNLFGLTGNKYSPVEVASQQQSNSLKTILHDPVNAPYKLWVWSGLKLGHHSVLVTRLAAAICALPLGILFYWTARRWFSRPASLLGALMFVTSSGALHASRFGSPMVLQLAPFVVTACIFLYRKTTHGNIIVYLSALFFCGLLYIPGMVWFALIEAALLWRRFGVAFKKLGMVHVGILLSMCLLLLAPLAWRSMQDLSILREILGLPSAIPQFSAVLGEAKHLLASVVYRGYWPTDYWLHGAPLLNLAEVVLCLTGLLYVWRRPIEKGAYYLTLGLLLCGFLVTLRGSVTIALLVPLLYLLITAGIELLGRDWFKTFPRNPFARILGAVLVVVLVAFSITYQLRAYFIAWPNAPETKAVYHVEQPS